MNFDLLIFDKYWNTWNTSQNKTNKLLKKTKKNGKIHEKKFPIYCVILNKSKRESKKFRCKKSRKTEHYKIFTLKINFQVISLQIFFRNSSRAISQILSFFFYASFAHAFSLCSPQKYLHSKFVNVQEEYGNEWFPCFLPLAKFFFSMAICFPFKWANAASIEIWL